MGKRRINWRLKVMLSILAATVLVITLLFGITYNYFLRKLRANDEKITYMTFQESENKLKEVLERTTEKMNRFSIWNISLHSPLQTILTPISSKKSKTRSI